jgi:hypothetical protein
MLEASSKEMSVFMDKADAMRYPEATSHGGLVTIDGKDVLFRGRAMSTSDASRAPEFEDFTTLTEAFVTCQ